MGEREVSLITTRLCPRLFLLFSLRHSHALLPENNSAITRRIPMCGAIADCGLTALVSSFVSPPYGSMDGFNNCVMGTFSIIQTFDRSFF